MDKFSAIFLAAALFIIMLGMGLSLTINDFKRVVLFPKAVITGLVNQIILLPLIGLLLALAFDVRPEIAVGIMILAACPGGATSNLITHLAKGDTALSVTLTAISSVITIFTIPFIVQYALVKFMAQQQEVILNIPGIIGQLFLITIVPVSVGMIVKAKKPAFALRMDKPVKTASALVLALVIAGLLVKEKSNVVPYFQQAGAIALMLNVASLVAGFLIAKYLMSLSSRQSVSISIESGIQNGTLAIAIATITLEMSELAIAGAIYSLIMFVTGVAIISMRGLLVPREISADTV